MRTLLILLLAGPAAAASTTKPWLSDGTYASQNVNVLESALPAGAATESTSVAVSTTLAAIKARADLLATEATLVTISTTLAAMNTRVSTTTVIITAATGDTIVKTPSSGKRIVLRHIYFANLDLVTTTLVKFKFGSGPYFWQKRLAATQSQEMSIAGANISGGVDESFTVGSSAALTTGLAITIIYDEL